MANFFDQFDAPTSPPAAKPVGNFFDQFDAPVARPAQKSADRYTYSVLPFSEDEQGRTRFDTNAGVIGAIKNAVTLPGDVATGKVDPNSDEGLKRIVELATMATPASPAVTLARPGVTPAPTTDALRAAEDAGYNKARGMGVDYSAQAVSDLARAMRTELEGRGIIAELAPKTFSVLSKLESAPPGAVAPLAGVEAARRAFGHAAWDFNNPTEQKAASQAIDAIDEFTSAADPLSVVSGPAAEAGRILENARGNSAAAFRSDRLTGLEDVAELRAAAANSGQDLDNAIRSRVASLLADKRRSAGFTPEEITGLEEVARGTPSRNALRMLGNFLGGGGGLGTLAASAAGAGAGSATMGVPGAVAGAAAPLAGFLAKRAANARTVRALEAVDEMTRRRSPLFQEMAASTPPRFSSPAGVNLVRLFGLANTPSATSSIADLFAGQQ